MITTLTVCVIVLALTVMYIMFSTDRRIDAIEEKFNSDSDTIDDLCEVVNDNSKDIEEAVNEHAESLDSLEGYSNHLALKVGLLEEDVLSLENDIAQTIQNVDEDKDNLNTTEEILGGMEDRLEEVEETSLSHSERLSMVEEALLENELDDINLNEKVNDLKDNLEFIYDTLDSYMDGNDETLKKIAKAIKFMSSAVLENWKEINSLSDYVSDLTDRVKSLESDFEYVKKTVGEEVDVINEKLDGFDIEVDYIERHLHEVDMLSKATARKYETDREKKALDDLWKTVEAHSRNFLEASEKNLPSSIVDAEFELYTKYYDMASSAQEEYDRKSIGECE